MKFNGKYLITTDKWFFAPDGLQYRAVWGDVKILSDTFLGVATNRNSTNWFAMVGTEHNHVIVAGCQIHYAVKTEREPNIEYVKDCQYGQEGIKEFERPTQIYLAK